MPDALHIVTEHNTRWALADLAGLCALYHPDIVFTDHYAGQRYAGTAVHTHVAGILKRSQLDSLHYTDRPRVDDDTVTLRYRETIRSSAGDELLAVTACDIVRVQDARIIAIDEYAIPEARTALPSTRKGKPSSGGTGGGMGIGKIGLSAREIGFLLADLDGWMRSALPFLDPALSLPQVAAATGYTRNQISFALNQVRGVGFFDYVNGMRVEHLLRRVPPPATGGALGWAEAAGFRSASTFYAAFRTATGMSPAAWLRSETPPTPPL
ncbi:nuclear transport factor 2 family protein [Curvibacter sp. APW13]|uniref:nuclear transport factor 2 family protein n=1 Tax=Curvibacter sp. APW13 TaxID=3077236 RepID=UPI0028DEDB6E|nr:nuclear transport factor 2 family protein [Curvibacter sp. APW13]MDT8991384.1 nuclear transport factor 2 family protein [Curvibacter sp. APW13]